MAWAGKGQKKMAAPESGGNHFWVKPACDAGLKAIAQGDTEAGILHA